jgi:hypothetical protein
VNNHLLLYILDGLILSCHDNIDWISLICFRFFCHIMSCCGIDWQMALEERRIFDSIVARQRDQEEAARKKEEAEKQRRVAARDAILQQAREREEAKKSQRFTGFDEGLFATLIRQQFNPFSFFEFAGLNQYWDCNPGVNVN